MTVHEALISYLGIKRVELQTCEYEINMCGQFMAGIRETDESDEVIYFIPPVDLRLEMKNDLTSNNKAD